MTMPNAVSASVTSARTCHSVLLPIRATFAVGVLNSSRTVATSRFAPGTGRWTWLQQACLGDCPLDTAFGDAVGRDMSWGLSPGHGPWGRVSGLVPRDPLVRRGSSRAT